MFRSADGKRVAGAFKEAASFAFMVAPARLRPTAAFVTGWLNIFAYLFTTSSGAIFPAQLIATVAEIYNPGYTAERWHIWLIYVALLILSTLIVVFRASLMPKIQFVFFCASVLAVAIISILLLAMSPVKQPAKKVLVDWNNTSGWSPGLGFMLVMGQAMWL